MSTIGSATTSAIDMLRNRIDLVHIPFTDRGSRLLLFRDGQSLSIRMVERWVKWEEQVGHYRTRVPIITGFVMLDGDVPLEMETETYPHVARLMTSVGPYYWTFIDPETLLIRLPAGRTTFQFDVSAVNAADTNPVHTDRRGGWLHGKRNVGYTTNALIVENEITVQSDTKNRVKVTFEAKDGDGFVLNVTPRLGFNRSIPDPDKTIEAARQRWQDWFDAVPEVIEPYRTQYYYAWWIMRAGLLNQRYFFTREALTPSKIHYVGVWHWDQFFHAIAYRHIDAKLAEDQIRILVDHQLANGMLPDAVHDEGLVTHLIKPVEAEVTKPPLMAWTILKLYEKSGNIDFLQEMYDPLLRWHRWWTTYNTDEHGLCEYHHPFSSGWDDSPIWDSGMPVTSPDLNTYLAIQQESIARIADLIGQHDDAKQFRADIDVTTRRMMDYLWDGEKGLFNATYHNQPIPVLTPMSLMPMWTGRLPAEVVKRLVEHLTNPDEFWPKYPIPTVAVNDPTFDPWQMWRGPTWVNVNYLFVEALEKVGEIDLSRELRHKTLDLLMTHNDIYEYYHPMTAEHPPKAAPIFGWSASVFIDLAIQETELQRQTAAENA